LRDAHENVWWDTGGFRSAAAFSAGDDELIAMKMNRVVIHAEIDEAETHGLRAARMSGVVAGAERPVK